MVSLPMLHDREGGVLRNHQIENLYVRGGEASHTYHTFLLLSRNVKMILALCPCNETAK